MKRLAVLSILLCATFIALAQETKRTLEFDDILKWNRITERVLANDGKTIVYKNEPWKGDPALKITTNNGEERLSIDGGTGAKITFGSGFVVFTIKPPVEHIRQLKLKKAKKDEMPKNQLGIYNLKTSSYEKINRIKSYKIPSKWGDWIAWQTEPEKNKKKEKKEEGEEDDDKSESAENAYSLSVKNFNTGNMFSIPFVTQYYFAEEKEILVFVSTGDDKEFNAGLYHYDLKKNDQTLLLTGEGDFKQITLNKEGSLVALLAEISEDKEDKKNYEMYLWSGNSVAEKVLDNANEAIPENWEISANGRLSFSESENRIFFGTAPVKPENDTTILKEEIPVLDVWHWNEHVLQTQQINNKSRDLKKTYMAVFHIDKSEMVQLQTKKIDRLSLIDKGDHNYLLGVSNYPYAVQTMWEGSPAHNDFYFIDVNTGKARMIKKDCRATPAPSPDGKYLYWYNAIDSTWNTYNITSGKEYKVTSPEIIQCANELSDTPNPPGSYRIAGWTKNDEALLVYDRYDIWEVDPENNIGPVNLTKNGKSGRLTYRIITLDREQEYVDLDKIQYLTAHNEITREDGFYKLYNKKKSFPEKLIGGKYKLGAFAKAKDSDVVLYTKENFKTYPNLLVSDLKFEKSIQISDANPQQKDFFWGTAELYSWTSLDGRKLEGTLHKPENFDPHKKYPMIVNFYEKSSQGLYGYRMPECHRSTVDYHYYTSNGYIIFNPDVYYKEGYPGEDAFNCVMPGVTALIGEGFVDENHVGAQGHSWGGYQVAYLATRTNLFAAIESGAPVVNMFSAYGGIRWGSGLNRSFQYEHTQSRIGKSIWESPLRYIENSPLFTMDKVTTPILIMHNDNDGAVPWYQGIEYFIALRRMGKKAWLLNYNEADHWPTKVRDKHDFQIRLAQFFDHYLKGAPMPKWMKEGIPAVNKGIDLGYELIK